MKNKFLLLIVFLSAFLSACSGNKEVVLICNSYLLSESELNLSFISIYYNSSNEIIRIAGNVFDAADSSFMLIGAPVRLQKNNIDSIFTSTDYEGKFTVQFRLPEYDTLTASFIGYKRKKIDIRKKLLEFSKHWIK